MDITNPGLLTMAAAAVFVIYIYISEAVRAKKKALPAPESKPVIEAAPSAGLPEKETMTGSLVIEGADDETAAVIMAVISHESGIPLNRLSFKSIKLMEE